MNFGALLLAASALGPSAVQRPNVLMVVADDLAERDMAHLETPTFDALAPRGLRFRRAYANPTCSPSRWSIHFGQYHTKDAGPVCDGYQADSAPSPEQASLPRLFSSAGYHTALFGKWHLGSHAGVMRGEPWERTPELHGYDTWRAGLPVNVKSCGGRGYNRWLRVDDGDSQRSDEYVPNAIRDAFLAWHEDASTADRPWFAMVCFQLPHSPFHTAPGASYGPWGQTRRQKYESQVRYLDEVLEAELAPVDLEQTIVVVLGDNGAPPGAARVGLHPRKAKATTFEDGVRVPMLWLGPGIPAGAETSALVHVADLLPTFAAVIGQELDTGELDGVSVAALLENPAVTPREHVWCGLGPNRNAPGGDFAVVTSRHKLRRVGQREELYDLTLDPTEDVNLIDREEHAALVETLRAVLETHAAGR